MAVECPSPGTSKNSKSQTMKRREYILLSAALLIAFTSCDKSNPELVNESDRIDFVATPFHESFIQANQARGSETRNDNIQDFGVYAYYTADVFNPVSSTPNFMCNTQVRKTSNQWTYEPLMFWPNSGTLSFFAYSPYANQGDSYTSLSSTPSTEGYPQLAYTVPDDVTKQRDLLVSVPLIDQTKADVPAGGKLTLAFKHTLACVVFQAKMTAARELPVKVTSITFGQLKNKADFAYGDTPGTSAIFTNDRGFGFIHPQRSVLNPRATMFNNPEAHAFSSFTRTSFFVRSEFNKSSTNHTGKKLN